MMAMEFRTEVPKYDIRFEDISCSVRGVKKGSEQKIILNRVSGFFQPGKLSAIIGPSGSGKTTLMNILSGFRTKGVKGKVIVGGKERVPRDFRRHSCYIEQEVAMMNYLTAHETMIVASQLKMPSHVTQEQKEKNIDSIVDLLGLKDCLDTLVCKLSGGEKKRLSIAVELITNPPIMFFDEPTSNLDSMASSVVLSHLRWLANAGRTVVCVIHQPSSRLFSMFDDLLALSAGEAIYHGANSELVPFLASHGFHCPEYYNPSDFAIEVACGEHGRNIQELVAANRAELAKKKDKGQGTNGGLVNGDMKEEDSEESEEVNGALLKDSVAVVMHVDEKKLPHGQSESSYPFSAECYKKFGQSSRTSTSTQLKTLLWRSSICTYRNLYLTQLTLFGHLLVGLLLGVIFYDIGGEASKAISNAGCLFFFLLFLFFANSMPTVQTYPIEMPVIIRQYRNGWFSLKAYFLSKSIADAPMQVISPTLFLVAAYYLTGQPLEWTRGAMVWAICLVYTAIAQGVGLVFGAAFDVDFAVFLVPLTTIPMLLFSGFFVHLNALPSFIWGLSYISHSRYAYEGAMQAVYGFNRTSLHCSEPYCFFRVPEKLLKEMHLDDMSYWADLGALLVFWALTKICLYVILYRKLTPRQETGKAEKFKWTF